MHFAYSMYKLYLIINSLDYLKVSCSILMTVSIISLKSIKTHRKFKCTQNVLSSNFKQE